MKTTLYIVAACLIAGVILLLLSRKTKNVQPATEGINPDAKSLLAQFNANAGIIRDSAYSNSNTTFNNQYQIDYLKSYLGDLEARVVSLETSPFA